MLIFYSFGLALALIVGSPWWLFRMITSGKYREGLGERLGIVPRRIRHSLAPAHGSRVVWIHAVSVGEVLAASRLIDELPQRLNGADAGGWRIFISTTTRTGQRLARERFGAERVFYFPLDFAFAVRSWLRALRPRMLVLVETEFWPRMLAECRRAEVPVAVVNARISDRSWPRYRRLAFLWKRLLHDLAAVLAQTELDAQRLRALAAGSRLHSVRVAGNLKYDIRSPKAAPITDLLRRYVPAGTPILVCGSTLHGEEEMLLDALPPGIVTVVAPRHPERFAVVADLLTRRGLAWLRRSAWVEKPTAIAGGTVFLLDSIGELASVYSLADAAFVGGSLVPAGGHNPLEPAQFSVPVLMGPSYENFRGIVEALRKADAIRLVAPESLAAVLAQTLSDKAAAVALGERAHRVFESEAGATARVAEALTAVLEQRR